MCKEKVSLRSRTYLLPNETNAHYFPFISMVSVVFLVISMLFAYRVIEFVGFLTPGGVFVFPLTYFLADVVSEVYGYDKAKTLIWGNLFCIFIFNILTAVLITFPSTEGSQIVAAYNEVFGHSITLMATFSISFIFGDFVNAYFVSKWKILMKGRFFGLRSIGSSIIGEIIFTIIATSFIYTQNLPTSMLARQFLTTLLIKIIITLILAYPGVILAAILRKIERNFFHEVNDEMFPISVEKP